MTNEISIRNAKYAKIGLRDMCDYIGDMSEMTVIEIGSYVGDSSKIFAQRAKEVHCIDPWKNGYDDNDGASSGEPMFVVEAQFDRLCRVYGNINKMKMKGTQAAQYFTVDSVDVVYVDGLHTEEGVLKDIEAWLPKIKKGGFICGHDYNSRHFPGVKKAVNSFFKPDEIFRDSSWLVKII